MQRFVLGLGVFACGCLPDADHVVSGTDTDGSTSTGPTSTGPTSSAGSDTTSTSDRGTGSSSSTGGPATGACDGHDGAVIFVNFGGVTLTEGGEDATADTTQIPGFAGEYAPFDGERPEILAIVRDAFSPFDVCVTDARPGEGDYTMAVISPTRKDPAPQTFGGAAMDCGGANPNGIAFTYTDVISDPEVLGAWTARHLAHTYGLTVHQEGPDDFMTTAIPGPSGTSSFRDECFPLGTEQSCAPFPNSCEDGINTYRELLAVLGPA